MESHWCRAGEGPLPEGLDPKVVEVYQGVGVLLSRYTTGKLPKAFKIIPNLRNWEEVRPPVWIDRPRSAAPVSIMICIGQQNRCPHFELCGMFF